MFRPERMLKLRIYGIKSKQDAILDLIQREGVIEITEVDLPGLSHGHPPSYYSKVSQYLMLLNNLFEFFPESLKQDNYKASLLDLDKAINLAKSMEGDIKAIIDLFRRVEMLKSEAHDIEIEIKNLERIVSLFGDLPESPKNAIVLCFKIPKRYVGEIKKISSKIPNSLLFNKHWDEEHDVVILITPFKENLKDYLSSLPIEYINIPKEGTRVGLKNMENKLNELKLEISDLEARIYNFFKNNAKDLLNLHYTFSVYENRASVSLNFAESDMFFVMEGWIPEKYFDKLRRKLKRKFSKFINIEVVETKEMPPTLLSNPTYVKPFEFLVKYLSMPRYDDIDVSLIYFFTIPLLFGMIIGDVGYSIITILISDILQNRYRHSKSIKALAGILKISAMGGIIWGIIFDEWFGASHMFWFNTLSSFGIKLIAHPIYHGFRRIESLTALIGLSIIIGIVHITAGFILGLINEILNRNAKGALSKIFWIVVLYSGIGVVLALFGVLHNVLSLLIPTFIIGVFGLFLTEGIVGVFEISGLLGNILSYTRLAAFGIVGVIISELINHFMQPSPEKGLLNIIIIPAMFFLHFLNAVLAIFEGIVQGGRLNAVEFATKFFHGGGKPFVPFKMR